MTKKPMEMKTYLCPCCQTIFYDSLPDESDERELERFIADLPEGWEALDFLIEPCPRCRGEDNPWRPKETAEMIEKIALGRRGFADFFQKHLFGKPAEQWEEILINIIANSDSDSEDESDAQE